MSQIAEKKFQHAMLLGGLSVNLNNLTKGLKLAVSCTHSAPSGLGSSNAPTTRSKANLASIQTPGPNKKDSDMKATHASGAAENRSISKRFGLKITHHGIVRQPSVIKERKCTCKMCGEKFKNSTLFMEHYSTTHPPLVCKHCSKSYTNPLSLQKHVYVHTAEKKTCDSCG